MSKGQANWFYNHNGKYLQMGALEFRLKLTVTVLWEEIEEKRGGYHAPI